MRLFAIIATVSCIGYGGPALTQNCLEQLTEDSLYADLVKCIKTGLVAEVANDLSVRHADDLRGPEGPPFVPDRITVTEFRPEGFREFMGSTPYSAAITSEGVVVLGGRMAGCPMLNQPVFTLPKGFAPRGVQSFPVDGGSSFPASVVIDSEGSVFYSNSGFALPSEESLGRPALANCAGMAADRNNPRPPYLSLGGISFIAK